MELEWDDQKYLENIEKHQVDFIVAVLIFRSSTVAKVDTRHDYGETRYEAVGFVGEDCFVVVFTRRGERFRIISARRGGRRDRRDYDANVSGRRDPSI